jgi:uncharacterized SAM-binding protein YcdF (DUF218 family)
MLIVLAIVGAWIAAAWWLDRRGRQSSPTGSYDALVVPGCAVGADGQPSPALDRRVRGAVALYDRGLAPVIVLTGGTGVHGHCEAEAAALLCRGLGVPDAVLRLERTSHSTRENAKFAAEASGGRVLVVTDAYHVSRCRRVFREYFREADAVASMGREAPMRWQPALREVGCWLKLAATVGR